MSKAKMEKASPQHVHMFRAGFLCFYRAKHESFDLRSKLKHGLAHGVRAGEAKHESFDLRSKLKLPGFDQRMKSAAAKPKKYFKKT